MCNSFLLAYEDPTVEYTGEAKQIMIPKSMPFGRKEGEDVTLDIRKVEFKDERDKEEREEREHRPHEYALMY